MKINFRLVRSAFFLLSLFTLCACKEKDAAYFLIHPEEIQPTYNQCLEAGDKMNAKECASVLASLPTFRSYMLELINNPVRYGLNLMHAEVACVELQKQYQIAYQVRDTKNLERLKQQIAKQKLIIQSRLAMIRLAFKMNQ